MFSRSQRRTYGLYTTFAAIATLLLAGSAVAQTAPQGPVIVTRGDGTVTLPPDRAWLTISTQSRDTRASEARRKSAEAMTAVQATLKGLGLAEDAVRTIGYSLTPEMDYDNGRSILRGYVVRNQIEVRIDDLDKLSRVLDAVNSPDRTALSISGPRFDLKDRTTAERRAIELAVQDAMGRAHAISTGAGRSLGDILRIDDQTASAPPSMPVPVMARMAEAAGPPTPITPGDIEVTAHVSVTVELR